MFIKNVDICCGLAWGDEAKGKIVTELIKTNNYDWVCRWSGGSNAGHTIYINGNKYHSNVIPSGIFYNKKSFIGPQCFINLEDLDNELKYLHENGFDINNLRVSVNVHIISNHHKLEDSSKYKQSQGSTGKGIAPCARDKYARTGLRLIDILNSDVYFKHLTYFNREIHVMNENLNGNILCEGAQGFWLDIDHGNYPYVTSSITLPYSACSLGFPPQKIRNIYGASKIYDTRVGVDPEFDDSLLEDEDLTKIALIGKEFGTVTGRGRKVNWLNIEKLIDSINISGTNIVIISKTDVLQELGIFKLSNGTIFQSLDSMEKYIEEHLKSNCQYLEKVIFSNSPSNVNFS